jgi:hypothetical protein
MVDYTIWLIYYNTIINGYNNSHRIPFFINYYGIISQHSFGTTPLTWQSSAPQFFHGTARRSTLLGRLSNSMAEPQEFVAYKYMKTRSELGKNVDLNAKIDLINI